MGLSATVPEWLRASTPGTEIAEHVQPGAARDEPWGTPGDALKIRVAARAIAGSANGAVREFLATYLGLPRNEVRIPRGERSRPKTIRVAPPPDQVAHRLTGNSA